MPRILTVLFVLVAVAAGVWLLQPARADLVVYCAHDSLYAEPFFRRFTQDTGIRVDVRYDTEATKSLGLTELIERESADPRCDVFWNNEPLGSIRLAERGLLVPYASAGRARIPERFRDAEGRWIGFAARLRVWIVHTPTLAADAAKIEAVLAADRPANLAIAKPLYGTTRSHFTAMWEQLGPLRTKRWHENLRDRGAQVVNGNAVVKDLVAAGTCALGLTDTDDYFLAVDAGAPVDMVPARLQDGSTLCVPNTAGIVKGCKNLPAAQQLIDYLTSERSEVALANSRSRQIPLGPVDESELPPEVRELLPFAKTTCSFRDSAAASDACLAWLREVYVR